MEATRILHRPHDAEEVVQEALARAWRSRGSCRRSEAPLPWCLRITRNEALRLIGRQRALVGAELLDTRPELEDERALRETERTVDRIDVERALRALTQQQRELVALRYECDYSHSQIAEKLQMPEATVRVQLHRAKKRLRGVLEAPDA